MQKMWKLELQWNKDVSINREWSAIRRSLESVHLIKIPRFIIPGPTTVAVVLHGFADASQLAFGEVVYLKIESKS